MTTQRPRLTAGLTEAAFGHWYWLKSELVAFCRAHHLSATGSKQLLAARIAAHLAARPLPHVVEQAKPRSDMPTELKLGTRIGTGWKCNQRLRGFFVSHCGTRFHFNGPLRDFIANSAGRTLGDAVTRYQQSLSEGPRSISRQFEYNTHMREFRQRNPGGSHANAVAAWWAKRGEASAITGR